MFVIAPWRKIAARENVPVWSMVSVAARLRSARTPSHTRYAAPA